VLSEGEARGIPLLARIRRDRLPRLQPALPGDGSKNVAEEIDDRQHIAQSRVRAAFRQTEILAQALFPAGTGIKKLPRSRNAQIPARPMGAIPSPVHLDQVPRSISPQSPSDVPCSNPLSHSDFPNLGLEGPNRRSTTFMPSAQSHSAFPFE